MAAAQNYAGPYNLPSFQMWYLEKPKEGGTFTIPSSSTRFPVVRGIYKDGAGFAELAIKNGTEWIPVRLPPDAAMLPGIPLRPGTYRIQSPSATAPTIFIYGYQANPLSSTTARPGEDFYPPLDRLWCVHSDLGDATEFTVPTGAKYQLMYLNPKNYLYRVEADNSETRLITWSWNVTFPGLQLKPGKYRIKRDLLSDPVICGGYISRT